MKTGYEAVFEEIRKHSKYCSRCGGKLDLERKDWHMPFCHKCRKEIIEKLMSK